ncbi:hypothetical protein DMA11_00240 [Marinilabiliaceae bacterium JC017]|nr:hypothetical protein DMA11_00240 [Marinilabiliaceae bacterium JC017]
MKKLIFGFALSIAVLACSTNAKQKSAEQSTCCSDETVKTETPCCNGNTKTTETIEASIDDIFATPEKYLNKTVKIKGRVIHTCRKSGKKMFLAGTDKNKLVKVFAGENIARFEETLEGEMVVAQGKLTVLIEEHEEGDNHECTTENKSKDYQLACMSFTIAE